jgi:outer membrane receptor protein involved in Fe transport
VTARSGDNAGNYLKAIPRHFIVTGLSAGSHGVLVTMSVTSAKQMYLDDANEQTIPDWTRWDARASYTRGELSVFADLLNLADAVYSTTGFPDPAGSGEIYMHPAAGRTLHVGLSWRR